MRAAVSNRIPSRSGRMLFCAWLLVLALMVLSHAASANGAATPYRILVLNSYHIGMQWGDRITQGILSELEQSELNLEIFIEHMDTKRYAPEKIFPHLVILYADKYKTPPDLLIAVDDNALNFVVEHRDTLFRDLPVVFAGINNYENARRLHPMGVTGVLERVEIKQTLELILKLHPNTQRIIGIADWFLLPPSI